MDVDSANANNSRGIEGCVYVINEFVHAESRVGGGSDKSEK